MPWHLIVDRSAVTGYTVRFKHGQPRSCNVASRSGQMTPGWQMTRGWQVMPVRTVAMRMQISRSRPQTLASAV